MDTEKIVTCRVCGQPEGVVMNHVHKTCYGCMNTRQPRANREYRLQQAAPELLEALKELVKASHGESIEPMGSAIQRAERVMAKIVSCLMKE